jgi:hypothetical protein
MWGPGTNEYNKFQDKYQNKWIQGGRFNKYYDTKNFLVEAERKRNEEAEQEKEAEKGTTISADSNKLYSYDEDGENLIITNNTSCNQAKIGDYYYYLDEFRSFYNHYGERKIATTIQGKKVIDCQNLKADGVPIKGIYSEVIGDLNLTEGNIVTMGTQIDTSSKDHGTSYPENIWRPNLGSIGTIHTHPNECKKIVALWKINNQTTDFNKEFGPSLTDFKAIAYNKEGIWNVVVSNKFIYLYKPKINGSFFIKIKL